MALYYILFYFFDDKIGLKLSKNTKEDTTKYVDCKIKYSTSCYSVTQ